MPIPATTFEALREASACENRYRRLAKALGGIRAYGSQTPISLLQILEANDLEDALWALRACEGAETFSRLLACDYAEHVLPAWEARYPGDGGPRKCVETARACAEGRASMQGLRAVWDALPFIKDAEWGTAWCAARDAAWCAAWSAPDIAAYEAADGAFDAARLAVKEGGWDAALRTEEAERAWMEQRLRERLAEC